MKPSTLHARFHLVPARATYDAGRLSVGVTRRFLALMASPLEAGSLTTVGTPVASAACTWTGWWGGGGGNCAVQLSVPSCYFPCSLCHDLPVVFSTVDPRRAEGASAFPPHLAWPAPGRAGGQPRRAGQRAATLQAPAGSSQPTRTRDMCQAARTGTRTAASPDSTDRAIYSAAVSPTLNLGRGRIGLRTAGRSFSTMPDASSRSADLAIGRSLRRAREVQVTPPRRTVVTCAERDPVNTACP